jgi:eukaryotic-like serine/threonine-protein kinase
MEGMPAEGTGLPAIGAEIAGKYRVEGVLGQGGMGAVYAARNLMTGKRVAIKWLLPEHAASNTRERLLREAQIASSIDHPNVVDIYDVGEHQGGLFLVMEYLRGKPLSDVLAERGRLDPDELIALLVPAMRGVHAAHVAGVVHRDLKPENIILSESDGQIVPKVLDFGISKTTGASTVPNSSLTRTGALVGTPHYMALEQVDGSNDIDSRTDVYAFGVLLYRSLTGHFPFDGSSLGEVILKIGTKEAVPMRMLRPELPPALDNVVLRALSRDRGKRMPDLEELARLLAPFAATRAPGDSSIDAALPPGAVNFRSLGPLTHGGSGPRRILSARPTPVLGRGSRRRRTLWLSAGAAVVLFAAGAFLLRRDAAIARPIAPAQAAAKVVELDSPPARDVASTRASSLPAAVGGVSAGAGVMIEGKDEPLNEPVPTVEPLAEAPSSAQAPTPTPTPAVQDVEAAAPVSKADKRKAERSKASRAAQKSSKANATMIPGERTNGFSVDEF